MIEAEAITDSIGEFSPRLLTIKSTSPKFTHQETLRHRLIYIEDALRGDPDFSFSVSSARAIPFPTLLKEVTSKETMARHVAWFAEKKGMSPGDELPADVSAECDFIWEQAAEHAAYWAQLLADKGVHKSQVNRIIEPYMHVHVLMTATEPGWMNFFGLRLDKAADPTLRELAKACWRVWNESKPKMLQPGRWHLPFIPPEQVAYGDSEWFEAAIKSSVARCARLSYLSFETGRLSTMQEDLRLYDKLIGSSPIHASPAEHQATPCDRTFDADLGWFWDQPGKGGNLGPGWVQYRKLLPGENLAPLPAEYQNG